ncbi:M48 family metalloprotease [bacterium]|nr:M48 family metalloprotease [bacterium]
MTDVLITSGLSNAVFSLLLAAIALVVGALSRRAHVAYLLWLLVIVKLLMPPVVSIPVAEALWQAPDQIARTEPVQPTTATTAGAGDGPIGPLDLAAVPAVLNDQPQPHPVWLGYLKTWLPFGLLAGSLIGLLWSLITLANFSRRLADQSQPAPEQLQDLARQLAAQLQLDTVPVVYATGARLSPLVWWLKGHVAVVVPDELIGQLDEQQWRWILAHELAHIRRRDYLVRWVEWLACIGFWWNPVVWWAKRQLRAAEEICCDNLVLTRLKPQPSSYAKSLLTVVEFLADPALNPPALASEINSGGFFLRRCRMIVSDKPKRTPARWMLVLVFVFALVVLPLGAHLYAKDQEVKKEKPVAGETEKKEQAEQKIKAEKMSAEEYLQSVEQELQAKVEAGELTEPEAKAKLEEMQTAQYLNAVTSASYQAEFEAIKAELEVAIASGKLSEQEAQEIVAKKEAAIKKKIVAQQEGYAAMAKAWERQETLISEGMVTFEEAVKEYEAAKQQFLEAGDLYADAGEKYRAAVSAYQAKIKDGQMSTAEAFTHLSTVEMEGYAVSFLALETEYKMLAFEANLEAKVARGELSREEADAKLLAYQHDVQESLSTDEDVKVKFVAAMEDGQIAAEKSDEQKKQEAKQQAEAKQKSEK